MSQDGTFSRSCCRLIPKITKLYDAQMLILARKRLILTLLTGWSDVRRPRSMTSRWKKNFRDFLPDGHATRRQRSPLPCCLFCNEPWPCAFPLSALPPGASDIRNGIYGRPTTQQFARTPQQFARTPQQFARTHQQFERTHQQFERTHQQLAIERGDPAEISEMPATLALFYS